MKVDRFPSRADRNRVWGIFEKRLGPFCDRLSRFSNFIVIIQGSRRWSAGPRADLLQEPVMNLILTFPKMFKLFQKSMYNVPAVDNIERVRGHLTQTPRLSFFLIQNDTSI